MAIISNASLTIKYAGHRPVSVALGSVVELIRRRDLVDHQARFVLGARSLNCTVGQYKNARPTLIIAGRIIAA
jgi:hypothetical protein